MEGRQRKPSASIGHSEGSMFLSFPGWTGLNSLFYFHGVFLTTAYLCLWGFHTWT